MGIRSTRDITLEKAIYRILEVDELLQNKSYRELEETTSEHDYSLSYFVDNTDPLCLSKEELEKWTDTMITDKIDEPFYRFSMFDNYLIKNIDD